MQRPFPSARLLFLASALALTACATPPPDRVRLAERPPPFERGDELSTTPVALLFVACDGDSDRRIDVDERDAGIEREFRRADTDGNGSIESAEYARWALATLGSDLATPKEAQADRNGDRRITLEEFADTLRQEFVRLDANGDGALARSELVTQRVSAPAMEMSGGRGPGGRRGRPPGGRPPGG